MLLLCASLDLYFYVERAFQVRNGAIGETCSAASRCPALSRCPAMQGQEALQPPLTSGDAHNLTAEMALPNGEILAIDQVGWGAEATVSLVALEAGGRSARVLYRGAPGEGLLGGVYDGGRRFNVQGPGGVYHIDSRGALVGWTNLPEGVLEDLEAGMAVVGADRPDGTSHFYIYRGQELRHEFHLSGKALTGRLSPDGRTFGVLMPGRLRLVPLASTDMPIDVALDADVRADLIVSDSGRHALVMRADGGAVGLVSAAGLEWFDVDLGNPNQPLEAGVAELDPTSGRFAVTDGRRLLVGCTGNARLLEVLEANRPTETLHLGEWTPDQGILFTVRRGGLLPGGETPDGIYFLDPETAQVRAFSVTEACVPSLEQQASCGAGDQSTFY